MRKRLDNPGLPLRWRGWVPMAAEGDGGGAAPKPDANQAKASAEAAAAQKAEADRQAAEAQKKAEAERQAAEAAHAEAQKKAEAERVEASKRLAANPDELAKKLADIDRTWDERGKAIDAKASALESKLERARQKSVISTLRRLGADPAIITDEDLLALAPKVDPDEPAGLAALSKWRDDRPGYFKRAKVGPQERVTAYKAQIAENKNLTPEQRARRERMMSRLGGGE